MIQLIFIWSRKYSPCNKVEQSNLPPSNLRRVWNMGNHCCFFFFLVEPVKYKLKALNIWADNFNASCVDRGKISRDFTGKGSIVRKKWLYLSRIGQLCTASHERRQYSQSKALSLCSLPSTGTSTVLFLTSSCCFAILLYSVANEIISPAYCVKYVPTGQGRENWHVSLTRSHAWFLSRTSFSWTCAKRSRMAVEILKRN